MLLIIGLGNPGLQYQKTRHNVGFMSLDLLAKLNNLSFQYGFSKKTLLAKGYIQEADVLLLKPMTYMNNSGQIIKAVKDFFKIPMQNLLVVCDDIYLPFGTLRMKTKGGSGGHNGLKSIESCLVSNEYARLRIGIGEPKEKALEDFVLSEYSLEEKQDLPRQLDDVLATIYRWMTNKK
ncbi:MAG: aminoacyl-tRNA hydrolase [Rhabdochlamydiaceae bacterium]